VMSVVSLGPVRRPFFDGGGLSARVGDLECIRYGGTQGRGEFGGRE
jgi:hypothetical protein